jgi:DNA-binding NtrC family response regulator
LSRELRILIASGDPVMLERLGTTVAEFRTAHVRVTKMNTLAGGLVGNEPPQIVFTDLPPDMSAIDLLARLNVCLPHAKVILLANRGDVSEAVDAMRAGAFTCLEQPVDRHTLLMTLENAWREHPLRGDEGELARPTTHSAATAAIVGRARPLRRLLDTVRSVAPSDANCLIVGENGTGKELIADAIHASSARAQGPFVKINCAAIPEELFESELFGHTKGAFTGAVADREGWLSRANGGSLLLDEIAEIVPRMQVKLLRVLQDREFRPVGSLRTVPLDARLICATNVHIGEAVRGERLREDLLFRINTVTLQVPPLRERIDDLPLLCSHFLDKHARRYDRSLRGFSPAAMETLSRYHWPGNVRELENVIERAVLLTPAWAVELSVLPEQVQCPVATHRTTLPPLTTLAQIERSAVLEALTRARWNRMEAARNLGIQQATLYSKMRKYAIRNPYRMCAVPEVLER